MLHTSIHQCTCNIYHLGDSRIYLKCIFNYIIIEFQWYIVCHYTLWKITLTLYTLYTLQFVIIICDILFIFSLTCPMVPRWHVLLRGLNKYFASASNETAEVISSVAGFHICASLLCLLPLTYKRMWVVYRDRVILILCRQKAFQLTIYDYTFYYIKYLLKRQV